MSTKRTNLIKANVYPSFSALLIIAVVYNASFAAGVESPYVDFTVVKSSLDTIPIIDRTGDFINDKKNNPFDITPSNISQTVEYDPATGKYVILEKIGEEYYRTPTYMTFEEYLNWKSKEQERAYFDKLTGVNAPRKRTSGVFDNLDPMSKVDIGGSLFNRLFGGAEVDIKPRGSVDLSLGFINYQKTENPALPIRQQRQIYIPGDFNMRPRLSVDGGIGDKMKLNFDYDNQASFNFDRRIKLEYDSKDFSEDDIIKKVQAGDVSLPLRSSLIPGPQSLFGLRTDLQFGKLKVTAIAAQQRSKQNSLQIQGGSSNQEIEIRPDSYDENRHFYISHYNRETYEQTLSNLPQINTSFKLAQIEVWISDDRGDYQQGSSMIAAVADIAEGDPDKLHDQMMPPFPPISPLPSYLTDLKGNALPDNRANGLFGALVQNGTSNDLDKTATILKGYGLKQGREFEVFRGRLLNQSEYTFHPELGFISLNIRLRPNQVLAASYKYYYIARCDTVYTVGQLATEGLESSLSQTGTTGEQQTSPPKVIFTKLLKPSNQQTTAPTWDLMMKNVYNLGTSQLNKEGFEFDIFYEDDFDDGSLKKYIPEEGLNTIPLLQLFGLDRLNRFGDPQPDGIFDYVPGVTVIERTGSIVFPVVEPFGSTLATQLNDSALVQKYVYQQLYDTTVTIARQSLELNKFVMKSKVKSATSGEYNLGGLFIPRGSVTVTAGGAQLIEGVDYEIDYGLGRLRVINPQYLSQATPINIKFEDQSLFSLQQKNMLGLRLDYEVNKKLNFGATYMRLWERPFTQKVNIGDDPINNRVYGLDVNYSDETPWLTNLVDKLPFYSTNAPSSITFSAEAALLQPGYSSGINLPGEDPDPVVSLDDFEGAINGLTLGGFNTNIWTLASTPSLDYKEAELNQDLRSNANRARLNWYQIDRSARIGNGDNTDSYTRLVDQTELFQREVELGQTELFTFDVSYYPKEKGPYNYDVPGGYPGYSSGITFDNQKNEFTLNSPETRWGGIMRYFQNADFEAANYEFIDFWVLNPFMERRDGEQHVNGEQGEIVFNLGNISEDVVKDNLQLFENALPTSNTTLNEVPVTDTKVGRVATNVPVANGFDQQFGKQQDVGFDGINDTLERQFFADYLAKLTAEAGRPIPQIINDPSNDNFVYFNDESIKDEPNLLTRLKRFNDPEGNAPLDNGQELQTFTRGNRLPESEDMNNNRSLDNAEAFHEYRLRVRNVNGEIDSISAGPYYKQKKNIVNSSTGQNEIWYRFQIPLSSGIAHDISGFRSIQFMRMYFTKFSSAKTFRFADFQLVRSSWRRSITKCPGTDVAAENVVFSVDEVGVEENSTKRPFNYLTPRGIKQERIYGNFSNLLQDEKSMSLNFCDLYQNCEVGINKLQTLNLNQYKRIQLFVHAESKEQTRIEDGKVGIFIKLGKDMTNNYYEYFMPLSFSNPDFGSNQDSIWLSDNFIDVPLEKFRDIKRSKLTNGILELDDPDRPGAKLRIKGVPSLGFVKVIEIGIRNIDSMGTHCGEVWVNELRAVGLSEDGGIAAQARLQAKMADLGELNFSGNLSTIGYGGIDQKLQSRAQEEVLTYNMAANLNLGKLLPKFIPLNLPMFAQYSKSITTPLYDPYQLDLTVREVAEISPAEQQADVYERARETSTIKSINFTNVKIDGTSKNKPWSPQNINASYAYNEIIKTDPIIAEDKSKETNVTLEYNYGSKGLTLQPLKFIKSKYLKLFSEFNVNLLPNKFGINTNMNRLTNSRQYRFPDTPVFVFDDQRFRWDRNYTLDWNLTKALRLSFNANVFSLVDELRQTGIANTAEDRRWVNEFGEDYTQRVRENSSIVKDYRNDNLKDLGRTKNYKHNINLTYTLPFALIPMMDFISASADYRSDYSWTAGALIYIDELNNTPGNIIQNTQSRNANATFNFDRLYSKWSYLKSIESSAAPAKTRTRSKVRPGTNEPEETKPDAKEEKPARAKGEKREPSSLEKILVRPLLALRTARFSYKEDFGTLIPGFKPQAGLLGMSDGFSSPGWQFATGAQPNIEKGASNNWLMNNQQWFNTSVNFNDQIVQNRTQNVTGRATLEPFKSFIIDVDFSKTYRKDHTEVFKSKGDEFMQLARYDIGSFEYSYFSLNTLFESSANVYARFKFYKEQVSNEILPNKPKPGQHPDYPGYAEGYGPTSYAVNVPAFLAAYTGKRPEEISLNLQDDVKNLNFIPKPNWSLRYDGLSKVGFFKNFLTSFTLRHGYKSTINVSKFNTAPDFLDSDPFLTNISNNNYYSRLEIPALTINESFNPLIGIQMKTKQNMNINFEYKKSRQLDLRLNANELSELKGQELVFGFGYVIQNFKGFTKEKKQRRKPKEEDTTKPNEPQKPAASPLTVTKNRTLTMNLDFSVREDKSDIYRLENNSAGQTNRGQRAVSLKPSIEYQMYKNLALRLFADYQKTAPFVTNQFPITRFQAGTTLRFTFN
ncbi:MAG: cell surface protein SprA [Saprospiraceae bacterium]